MISNTEEWKCKQLHIVLQKLLWELQEYSLKFSNVVGFMAYNLFFCTLNWKTPGGLKSGQQGGNFTGPCFPEHNPGNC